MGGGRSVTHGPWSGQDLSDPLRLSRGDWGDPSGVYTAEGGALSAAVFNTFRRSRNQVLYWAVPMLTAYIAMQWAVERNQYLNSKAGRAESGDD